MIRSRGANVVARAENHCVFSFVSPKTQFIIFDQANGYRNNQQRTSRIITCWERPFGGQATVWRINETKQRRSYNLRDAVSCPIWVGM